MFIGQTPKNLYYLRLNKPKMPKSSKICDKAPATKNRYETKMGIIMPLL